jgi:hypothetical protein
VATKVFTHQKVSVATSEQAMNLGGVTAALAEIFIVNRDESNYVELRSASGAGNDVVRLAPGRPALFQFGSDITAPYLIANTAACVVEYVLVSN